MTDKAPKDTLRRRALVGGLYLVVRRGFTVILQLGGVLLVTRLLGPSAYGVYHSALGLHTFLCSIGLMGVNVYLVRDKHASTRALYDLAFWWLLVFGIVLTVAGWGGVALGIGSAKAENFQLMAIFTVAATPFVLARYVPQAMLERALDYRYTAFLDVGGQLIFYGVAVSVAFAGGGMWALVGAFWSSQLFQTIGSYWATRYRPRWYWNGNQLREMLRFGFVFSLAGWIASVRNLLPAMLLLPYAGEKAVGYFAMAERLLQPLGFPKEIASRLAVPVFARLQDNLERLRNAMQEAIHVQTLAMGVAVAGFALVAPLGLPLLLGQRWEVPLLMQVFSWCAARLLISGLFALQGSALAVKKLNWVSVRGNIAFAIVLVGGSYLAVRYLPAETKLFGFLAADFAAFTVSYLYKNYYLTRYIGRPRYGAAPLWVMAMLCALFAPVVSGWLYALTAVLLLNPFSLREMRQLYQSLRRGVAPGSAGEAAVPSPDID